MNFTGRPVSIDIEPASAITLAVKCLEPKLPPVYIGWNSISSGAIFSVPEITQAAKLSMFEFECTVMRPVARSNEHTAPAGSIGEAHTRGQRSLRVITCAARAKSPSTSPWVNVFS